VPLVAVSRLALLAVGVGDGVVHVVLDAGRGEFYYGECVGSVCVREALLSGEDVLTAVGDGVVVVCEAKVAEALGGLRLRVVAEPSAGNALGLAVERIAAGEFDDAALVDANYLRRTDGEIFAKPKAGSVVG
jgi:tRNA threonylcarbamoyladenosine biosynthesis protein TsaB